MSFYILIEIIIFCQRFKTTTPIPNKSIQYKDSSCKIYNRNLQILCNTFTYKLFKVDSSLFWLQYICVGFGCIFFSSWFDMYALTITKRKYFKKTTTSDFVYYQSRSINEY